MSVEWLKPPRSHINEGSNIWRGKNQLLSWGLYFAKGAKYSVDPNTGHSLTENDFDLRGCFMPNQGKLLIPIKIRTRKHFFKHIIIQYTNQILLDEPIPIKLQKTMQKYIPKEWINGEKMTNENPMSWC